MRHWQAACGALRLRHRALVMPQRQVQFVALPASVPPGVESLLTRKVHGGPAPLATLALGASLGSPSWACPTLRESLASHGVYTSTASGRERARCQCQRALAPDRRRRRERGPQASSNRAVPVP